MADTTEPTGCPELEDVLLEVRQAPSPSAGSFGHAADSAGKPTTTVGRDALSAALSDSPTETTPSPEVKLNPPGVLIVDDEPAIRFLLERCCTLHGLQPFLAASGAEAVEVFHREGTNIGVVLLDVRMPGMSGPATLEVLRRLNPQVRCCFMSGDLGDYTVEDLCHRGALHLFDKPLPLRQLIAALQTILANPSVPS